MDNSLEPTTKRTLHPLLATAAVAVIVVSVLGAITLITSQVGAHRSDATPAAATSDSAASQGATLPAAASAPAAVVSAPDNSAAPHETAAPKPAAHPKPHKAPKPSAPSALAISEPSPAPPAVAPAVPPEVAVAAPPPPPPVCNDCGIVAGVRAVKTPGQGGPAGVIGGGVVGGLIGHQFGKGSGKDAMSILGVIGGAVAGHEVEKEVRATTHYEVDVRLDNGQLRSVRVPGDPGPIIGQRVRIENGQLVREAPQS
jgi:outer membrane lipoprotein SlyB